MQTMPFGKFKNRRLEELPESYLDWALSNLDSLRPQLRAALTQERERRQAGDNQSRGGDSISRQPAQTTTPANLPQVIHVWHQYLVDKYRPNAAALAVVDHAHERLRLLTGLEEQEAPEEDPPF
jgi:hypothetical protein